MLCVDSKPGGPFGESGIDITRTGEGYPTRDTVIEMLLANR